MKKQIVYLDNVPIGDGYPTAFMAEVGTFFNKDTELAQNFLIAAKNAGAHLFKTEILHSADVCLKNTGLIHNFNHASGQASEDYRSLVERKVVSFNAYSNLFKLCRKIKMPFAASVYDIEGINFLADEKACGIKISRDNVNNFALIEHAAKKNIPIIMDNGTLYFHEVAKAVDLIRKISNAGIIINHHPGCNPAPASCHNMKIMQTYKNTFGVPVGLACHYRGDEILYLAVGMGCNLIEKGIVDDPDKIEQDIVSALSLEELPIVVGKVKKCWEAIGLSYPEISEPRNKSSWKCFAAKKDIKKGEKLTLENISFAWPPLGISVSNWDLIKDKRLKESLKKGQPLKWEHLDISDFTDKDND